jgi:ABC-type transporter Mla MlaB component
VLKITLHHALEETAIRLEGRLVESALPLFEQACRDADAVPQHLRFDLAGLRHVDEASAQAIAQWIRRGSSVSGASPFVHELLEEASR